MHLIEAYALSCGCRIGSCFIQEQSLSLPTNPYITFHGYNPKGPSRQYRYWNEVINLLKLTPNFFYDIIEVGEKHNNNYGSNITYLGNTSYGELAFLIKNASLHLGFDSLPVHIASHYDKKIVAIYPHYAQISGPYFSSANNIQILEPDFSIIKPSFNYDDKYNLINTISPKLIYSSILKLLGI